MSFSSTHAASIFLGEAFPKNKVFVSLWILCSLDYTKSFGCDKIHPQVLKLCATSLLEPIHHIFQLCLSTSTLPREWKIHKIAPLPKKGDLSCVNNYRPISLLCIISKILESIIYKKIISFIRPKLSKTQFGFTKGKSCLSQLLTIFSTINQAADSKNSVDVMYLDFKKACASPIHHLWDNAVIPASIRKNISESYS